MYSIYHIMTKSNCHQQFMFSIITLPQIISQFIIVLLNVHRFGRNLPQTIPHLQIAVLRTIVNTRLTLLHHFYLFHHILIITCRQFLNIFVRLVRSMVYKLIMNFAIYIRHSFLI